MKTIFKYIVGCLFLIILLLIETGVYGQSAAVRKGDLYYDSYLYNDAISRYELIGKKRRDAHVLRRLAESYRLIGDTEKAEYYYDELAAKYPNEMIAEDHLHYAEVLQMNENYTEATTHWQMYSTMRSNEIRTSGQLKDIYYYNDLREDKGQFSIRNLKNNTDESDWGAVYTGDKIVFASSRHSTTPVYYEYNWNERHFYDLFEAKENPKNNKKLKGVKHLHAKGGLNGRFHEGPATFSADGNMMIFTKNSYAKRKDLNSTHTRQLELWYCIKDENGKWGKMQPMPFNSKEYSVGHAALSADGNTLYFVSDMPGGYGATDIYYSERVGNGDWSVPVNAGPNVNTEGKEMFPYYHSDGMLFFASDGQPGLGGLDIFVASAKTDKIGKAKNVGVPVNSSADDFAFVLNNQKKEGFFASNRAGGKGSDDIYGYDLLKPFQLTKKLEGITKDSKTGTILAATYVKLYDDKGTLLGETQTDDNGYYTFEVEPGMNLTLKGTHDKYKEVTRIVSTDVDEDVITADLLLDKIPEINLVVTVTDAKTHLPLEGVHVLVKDNNTGNVMYDLYTDRTGVSREALSPELMNKKISYSLTFEKKDYLAKTISYTHTIDKEGDINISTSMGKIELGVDIGRLIDLNPIYFDYNKWNIRPDAALELDRIVAVMKAYPDIEIELGAHTDCRGSKKYNMTLSDKRAKSSAIYIVSKGISKDRIYGKGYGESKLVNTCDCEGKVKDHCSEDEHALNRRTEFIVVRINTPQSTEK